MCKRSEGKEKLNPNSPLSNDRPWLHRAPNFNRSSQSDSDDKRRASDPEHTQRQGEKANRPSVADSLQKAYPLTSILPRLSAGLGSSFLSGPFCETLIAIAKSIFGSIGSDRGRETRRARTPRFVIIEMIFHFRFLVQTPRTLPMRSHDRFLFVR